MGSTCVIRKDYITIGRGHGCICRWVLWANGRDGQTKTPHTCNLSLCGQKTHPVSQADFLNWMAAEVGIPPVEDWRIELYTTILRSFSSLDCRYRDGIDADYWMQQSQLALQRTQCS